MLVVGARGSEVVIYFHLCLGLFFPFLFVFFLPLVNYSPERQPKCSGLITGATKFVILI